MVFRLTTQKVAVMAEETKGAAKARTREGAASRPLPTPLRFGGFWMGGCLQGEAGHPFSELAEVVDYSTLGPSTSGKPFPAAGHWSDLQELVEREGASLLPIPLLP